MHMRTQEVRQTTMVQYMLVFFVFWWRMIDTGSGNGTAVYRLIPDFKV